MSKSLLNTHHEHPQRRYMMLRLLTGESMSFDEPKALRIAAVSENVHSYMPSWRGVSSRLGVSSRAAYSKASSRSSSRKPSVPSLDIATNRHGRKTRAPGFCCAPARIFAVHELPALTHATFFLQRWNDEVADYPPLGWQKPKGTQARRAHHHLSPPPPGNA